MNGIYYCKYWFFISFSYTKCTAGFRSFRWCCLCDGVTQAPSTCKFQNKYKICKQWGEREWMRESRSINQYNELEKWHESGVFDELLKWIWFYLQKFRYALECYLGFRYLVCHSMQKGLVLVLFFYVHNLSDASAFSFIWAVRKWMACSIRIIGLINANVFCFARTLKMYAWMNERVCVCVRIYTVPKSGEKKSLMPFFFAGCGSAVRGCKTSPLNGIYKWVFVFDFKRFFYEYCVRMRINKHSPIR